MEDRSVVVTLTQALAQFETIGMPAGHAPKNLGHPSC